MSLVSGPTPHRSVQTETLALDADAPETLRTGPASLRRLCPQA